MKKRNVLRFNDDKTLEIIQEDEPKKPEDDSRNRYFAMISLASELGFSISLPIVGGAILGRLIDIRFGTAPRITLSLIFLGLMLGALNVYRVVKDSEKK